MKPLFKTNVPVRLPGSRFGGRNSMSEPRPQEPYRDIYETPSKIRDSDKSSELPQLVISSIEVEVHYT
jgi:hypothetical protein